MGRSLGCHRTRAQALRQIAALEAAETRKQVDEDELNEVFRKYHDLVNMSASELERWAKTEASGLASQSDAPITRNLRLLRTPKAEWTNRDIRDANRTIAFISRMSKAPQGKPARADISYSRRDISLRNWAYNPDKEKAFQLTQRQAGYTQQSENENEQCKNCRWFDRHGYCLIVQMYPLDIVAGGHCTRWEALPILKDFTLRRMFLVTSNAYEDREGETITSKALRDYVESQWDGEIFKGENYLLFQHRGAPIGRITFAEMSGPFLIEVAEELPTPYAKRRWDFIANHPDMDWGASHGFDFESDKRQPDGTFDEILKFETTVLPGSKAANLLTLAEVLKMMDFKRLLTFKRQTGLDDEAVDQLKESFDNIAAILGTNGIQHKQLDEEASPRETKMIEADEVAELIASVMASELENLPDNAMDIARMAAEQIIARMIEDVGEMETEEMTEESALQEAAGELAKIYYAEDKELREKVLEALDAEKAETTALSEIVGEDLAEIFAQLKSVSEKAEAVNELAATVKALETDLKAVKRILARTPRASQVIETQVAEEEILDEIQKQTEENTVKDPVFGNVKPA
jgi:hypothetical protein